MIVQTATALSGLILRSGAKHRVSKDGYKLRTPSPFETPAFASALAGSSG